MFYTTDNRSSLFYLLLIFRRWWHLFLPLKTAVFATTCEYEALNGAREHSYQILAAVLTGRIGNPRHSSRVSRGVLSRTRFASLHCEECYTVGSPSNPIVLVWHSPWQMSMATKVSLVYIEISGHIFIQSNSCSAFSSWEIHLFQKSRRPKHISCPSVGLSNGDLTRIVRIHCLLSGYNSISDVEQLDMLR